MGTLIGALIGALIGLIGVILVSIIGNAVAITILVVEHRRWKKEFNRQNLITERTRQEKQCDRIRELLDKAIDEKSYSAVLDGMWIRLPQKQRNLLDRAIKDIDRSQPEGKEKLRHEISFILGAYLGQIDKQIRRTTTL